MKKYLLSMKLHNILFYGFILLFFAGCDGGYQDSRHTRNSRPFYPNNHQDLTARKRELDKSPGERLADLRDKLQTISRERITKMSILNRSEKMLYGNIHKVLNEQYSNKYKNNFIVLPQISLGTFIKYENYVQYAYYFNSLRPDFTICDRSFEPICVIEYNGKGHLGDTVNSIKAEQIKVKDKMKRQILAKANIPLIVIKNGDNFSEKLKEKFGKILAKKEPRKSTR